MSKSKVAIYTDIDITYPAEPPYNPSIRYPEYFFKELSDKQNLVYNAIRESFILLGMDESHIGKSNWNPFKNLIEPGNTVILKPNFVRDIHSSRLNIFSIITHPSVLRAIIDYVYIALKGKGIIRIVDSPDLYCNFNNLVKITHLDKIKKLYKDNFDFNIDIIDLRKIRIMRINEKGTNHSDEQNLKGDPLGEEIINLGTKSLFYKKKNSNYYGADYNRSETINKHKL